MGLIQGIIRKLIFPHIDIDRFKGRLAENPTSKELRYKTLQKIFSMLVTIRDYETLTQKVVNVMVEEMDFIGGVLFLPDKDNKQLIAWSYTQSSLGKKVVGWLNKPFREHVYSLNLERNLTVQTYLTRKIHVGTRMSEFISPAVNVSLADTMQKFMDMNLCVSLPVVFLDKILGVVLFTSTRKESSQEEQEMLKTFSDQMAIALYNAKLYIELQLEINRFQEKTQDLASLLDISAIAASSLETKSITQKIVDSIPDKLGHLGYIGGILTMYDSQTTQIRPYSITESDIVQKKIKNLLSKPFTEYSVFANKDDSMLIRAIKTGEIQIGGNAGEFVSPPVDRSIANLSQKLLGMKSCAALPIFIRGQIIGAFIFLIKKESKEIGERDIALMKAFVNHIGISIDNAMLFDKTTKQIEELIKTKNNLEEAITMKNDFLQIVSHQLRTPLTAVRGFAYMWRDGDFDHLSGAKTKEIKMRVAENIDRLNNIVNDMIIAMESQGSMKLIFAPTDVEKLIKDNMEMFKSAYEKKGLYIKYNKMGGNIPLIEADGKYLRHVFMNLIDNAEKYTDKGGLEIAIRGERDTVYIRFVDTGIGISEEDRVRLFKKFSRGKHSSHINPGGSGLGLFIARQILDEHHGKIQISSLGEGRGTTLVIELPVKQPIVGGTADKAKPVVPKVILKA